MSPPPPSPLLPLPRDEVHVWQLLPERHTDPAVLEQCLTLLAPEEHARHQRFAFAKDGAEYLLGRALVRTVLSRYVAVPPAEWRFAANDHGKPFIAGPGPPPLQFNLSHTQGLLACVVARDLEIGVDVEHVERRCEHLGVARSFFAPEEIADIEHLPPGQVPGAFFDLWTLKEAYVKARGQGLAIPLTDFAFALGEDGTARLRFVRGGGDDPGCWQFERRTPTPGHRLAVAIRTPADRPITVQAREAQFDTRGGMIVLQ
jgi:4'-phosphopantetheinyl transferase